MHSDAQAVFHRDKITFSFCYIQAAKKNSRDEERKVCDEQNEKIRDDGDDCMHDLRFFRFANIRSRLQ